LSKGDGNDGGLTLVTLSGVEGPAAPREERSRGKTSC
jgi:hypothetical protein